MQTTTYQVGIYNQDVRACVKENETHIDYSDEWADIRYHAVEAIDQKEALTQIEEKYPSEKGFVVQSCSVV